ncbi:MAG: hypothetical protein M5U34_11195 [Chloroflexi bacterium]|nr:hypothetical protein [Chloroflexota bacterium]
MTTTSKNLPEIEVEAAGIPALPDPEPDDANDAESPLWSTNTKIIVTIAMLVLLVAITLRFTNVIRMVAMAAILAYLMNPIIAFTHRRTGIGRGIVVGIVYLLLAVLLVTADCHFRRSYLYSSHFFH